MTEKPTPIFSHKNTEGVTTDYFADGTARERDSEDYEGFIFNWSIFDGKLQWKRTTDVTWKDDDAEFQEAYGAYLAGLLLADAESAGTAAGQGVE